jgi:hypothetical protein
MNNLGVIKTGLPFFELNDYLNTVEREKNDKRKPCKTNRSVQLYLSTPKLFMICLTLFLSKGSSKPVQQGDELQAQLSCFQAKNLKEAQ